MLPQTDEQRGKRACALRARGIHQQRRERTLVGEQRKALLIVAETGLRLSSSSGIGTHLSTECAEAARIAWGGGRYKAARGAMREQGRSTGIASLPHVKIVACGCPGANG